MMKPLWIGLIEW